jgi:hypothetical protein
MRKLLLFLTIFSACVSAQEADRWVMVSISPAGMLTEYDTRTIERQASGVTVWVRYTYLKSPPVVSGKVMHHSIQRQYFNCGNQNSAVYSIAAYTEDGDVIASANYPSPDYAPVVPASVGEQTLDAVCR